MSTSTMNPTARPASLQNWQPFAVISAGIAAVLTAIGTFWSPLADYDATRTEHDFYSWLVVLGIIAVAIGIVFGLVVRGANQENAGRRAGVLATLGVLSVVVFWTGLPMVFVGGAACCALANAGRTSSRVILTVAVLVAGLAVFAALAG